MKNIHVLPTDKPSRLIIYSTLLNEFRLLDEPIEDWKHKRNIYITSDEEIKEGDWFHIPNHFIGFEHISKEFDNSLVSLNAKKIILTTDQDLIKDGVQAIDDEFLEWFVKNPKSENVYVYKKYKQVNQNNPVTRGSTALAFSHYEVQSLDLSAPIETNKKEVVSNLPNDDDFFKQETLEADEIITTTKFSWEEDKKMYSEEEVSELVDMLQKCKEYFLLKTDLKNKERADAIGQVLEQFKNK